MLKYIAGVWGGIGMGGLVYHCFVKDWWTIGFILIGILVAMTIHAIADRD